jgi:hypothetical protein
LVLPAFTGRTEEHLAKILFDNGLDNLVDVRNPLDITPMGHAGQLHLPDARVRADGDAVFRSSG